ncbi:MAG: 16S rRNA (guanine(527)-N(7))-methyltransferase RsmG [Stellaceae bacterium]
MRRDPPLDPERFAELVAVSRETLVRLEIYALLLTRWSARINLVGRDTLADLWRRHILDSAQLHQLVPAGAQSLVDLGSGAGLPGLVLALLGVPGVELVEADSRKAAFLREAARVTGTAVTIRPCRIAAVPPHPVDVVTARALAPLDRLLDLASPFLGPDTLVLLPKGEHAERELTEARKRWTMTASRHQSIADPRGVVLRLHRVIRGPDHG